MPTYLSPGVYVEEVQAGSRPIEGVGTAIAAFVGLAEKGPLNQPVLVTNWNQYVATFGEFVTGAYLPLSVYGFFQNGGGKCYVVRIPFAADGKAPGQAAVAELPSGADPTVGAYQVQALAAGTDGNQISVEIQAAGDTKEGTKPRGNAKDAPAADAKSDNSFKLVIKKGGQTAETYDNVTYAKGERNVATVVNDASKLVRLIEEAGAALETAPAPGSVSLSGGESPADTAETPSPEDYIGDPARRAGVGGLEAIDDITMICAPDIMGAYQAGHIDLRGVKAIQLAMISHCELMGNRMAIIDPPPGLNAQQIKEWRMEHAGYDSKFAALYWPWISVFDPDSGKNAYMPPSGHIAGLWGRNDDERGVHKAPANEVVRGAVELELNITRNEQDLLNPIGVNCIRTFPGRGIRVWGARTMSSDASWRYVNIRRYFNYLEDSILLGTQWCVFEPNDQALWGRIRRTIAAFLTMEWRQGALFGSTPAEAFYVKCDGENNVAESIDAGQVIVEIGIAPVKPAEFVIFRLTQFSGGASLSE